MRSPHTLPLQPLRMLWISGKSPPIHSQVSRQLCRGREGLPSLVLPAMPSPLSILAADGETEWEPGPAGSVGRSGYHNVWVDSNAMATFCSRTDMSMSMDCMYDIMNKIAEKRIWGDGSARDVLVQAWRSKLRCAPKHKMWSQLHVQCRGGSGVSGGSPEPTGQLV